MLIKFEVTNYAGFNKSFCFDLQSKKRYDYNKEMVEKKTIKKALVYGPNGCGKSSLCSALMDITYHIVDKQKNYIPDEIYFYAGSNNNGAKFIYTFKFDASIIQYEYKKSSPTALVYEKIYENGKLILEYNYYDQSHNVNLIPEAASLNFKELPTYISAVKFIFNNTILEKNSPIFRIVNYVSGMLYFKSLTEGNNYVGYSLGAENLSTILVRKNKVEDFKEFLKSQGLDYNLVMYTDQNGIQNLGIKFENGRVIPFSKIISSGTKTMWLFYCWMLEFDHLTMLIIDEFDSYYHYSTAQAILKIINSYSNMQAIITTHNMMLMNNELTRPDCCFILKNLEIKPLSSLTKKEIRQQNNLQKMYIDGEFANYFND